MNLLDPEPDRESSGYGEYIAELEEMKAKSNQPPTEEEYNSTDYGENRT